MNQHGLLRSCNHCKNSQIDIWRAVFSLARPADPVPDLSMTRYVPRSTMNTPSSSTLTQPVWTPSIPELQSPPSDEMTEPAQITQSASIYAPAPFGTSNTLSQGLQSTPLLRPFTLTPSVSLADVSSEMSSKVRELQTLAKMLLSHVDDPDPDGLEILREMYFSYKGDAVLESQNAQVDNCSAASTIGGLRKLCRQLWNVVNDPNIATAGRVRALREWAHGVLPPPATPTTVPSQTIHQHSFLESPDHNSGPPFINASPSLQFPSSPTFYGNSSVIDDRLQGTVLTADETDYASQYSGPFQFGPTILQPNFDNSDQLQGHFPAPAYMPFTHGDSAVASQPHAQSIAKDRSHRDSTYGTQERVSYPFGEADVDS